MTRRATAEEIRQHCAREMYLFDILAPCIRKVLREHSEAASLQHIFQRPGVMELAQQAPEEFARRLKSVMDEAAQINRANTRASVARMVKQAEDKLNAR